MLSHYCGLLAEFLLNSVAVLALLFVGYLLRLQLQAARRRRRMAEKGLRFGLIQDLTVSKRPLAAASPLAGASASFTSTIVPARDTGSRILTIRAATVAGQYSWN
jgi:hypothetical protein